MCLSISFAAPSDPGHFLLFSCSRAALVPDDVSYRWIYLLLSSPVALFALAAICCLMDVTHISVVVSTIRLLPVYASSYCLQRLLHLSNYTHHLNVTPVSMTLPSVWWLRDDVLELQHFLVASCLHLRN